MLRTLLGALLLIGLSTSVVPAQILSGQILSRQTLSAQSLPAPTLPGEPLGDVAITVENTESPVFTAKGVTGADGFVRFYNIPAGSYRVTTSNTARALERALRAAAQRAALAAAKNAPPPSDYPAPPPPPPSPPERRFASSLAMPVRPPSLTVLVTAAGTTRTARHAISALSDGMEMLQFTVAVSGPVAVSLRHEEE